MSLLGSAQAESACRIHAQFLVTDRIKSSVRIFLAGGKQCAYNSRTVSKSALGWLANKGERWMPRLEKAMKDVA